MSAIRGISICSLILSTALAASSSGTATRMISHPASSNAWIWATVAATSSVFVLHMDWMDTGAPPPTATLPTINFFVILIAYFTNLNTSWNVTSSIKPISRTKPAVLMAA